MKATLQSGEFGPIGHENGLPKAPEQQTYHETEAGVLPGDSKSKIGADPDVIGRAENAVAEAAEQEKLQAAEAARADIAEIHGSAQPAPSTEETTPYPVHTLADFGQRPVATNLTPQLPQTPRSHRDNLSGPQLVTQIRHDLQKH